MAVERFRERARLTEGDRQWLYKTPKPAARRTSSCRVLEVTKPWKYRVAGNGLTAGCQSSPEGTKSSTVPSESERYGWESDFQEIAVTGS